MNRSATCTVYSLIYLTVGLLLTACGGGGGGGGDLEVVSISPANGASGVPLNSTLRVQLSGPIDNGELSGITVHLRPRLDATQPLTSLLNAPTRPADTTKAQPQLTAALPGIPLQGGSQIADEPGTLAFLLSSNTVIFTPTRTLFRDASYEVTVTGIPDGGGGTLSPQHTTFRTVINPLTRLTLFNTGSESSYTDYTQDSAGNTVRAVTRSGPGTDTVWKTPDDTIGSLTAYTYDSNNRMTRLINYNNAGVDGIPFTPDDPVNSWAEATYDANGNQLTNIHYSALGPDGMMFTADDLVGIAYFSMTYDSAGNRTSQATWVGNGLDGQVMTADDTVVRLETYAHDSNGFRTHTTVYSGVIALDGNGQPIADLANLDNASLEERDSRGNVTRLLTISEAGADATLFTADDVVPKYFEQSFDSFGNRVQRIDYTSGADSRPGGGDDTAVELSLATIAADGRVLNEQQFDSAGADGIPFSEDDTPTQFLVMQFDGAGREIRQEHYVDVGPDLTPFTGDDVLSGYDHIAYDIYGFPTEFAEFCCSLDLDGPNDMIFDMDDAVRSFTTKSFTTDGSLISEQRYSSLGVGADGVVFTNDDQPFSTLEFSTAY